MKKILALALALTLSASALAFAGCGEKKTDDKTITVGASSTPHAEILEQVKAPLAEQGYTLDIKVFDDYVLPNTALNDGELDANYFQHTPYLVSFNEKNGTKLASAALIHYEPFGIYGNAVASLADLEEGATILIPADDSNETRALLLLEQEGLIVLPEDASAAVGVTTLDI
ncbi:MAG: metal ABC transporter substrate-binding protein, partial [Clostridia bacterium]|nr:metal ABC transporter substrate-binding protein [Clostridia bacterium]